MAGESLIFVTTSVNTVLTAVNASGTIVLTAPDQTGAQLPGMSAFLTILRLL